MKCGECLAERAKIVELDCDGKCPDCGTDYGDVLADEVNQRLIDAAPRLLAALAAVMQHEHVQSYLPYDPTDSVFLDALAAIRQARGSADHAEEPNHENPDSGD